MILTPFHYHTRAISAFQKWCETLSKNLTKYVYILKVLLTKVTGVFVKDSKARNFFVKKIKYFNFQYTDYTYLYKGVCYDRPTSFYQGI